MMQRLVAGLVAVWLAGCAGVSQVTVTPTLAVAPSLIPATPMAQANKAETRLISSKSIHDYYWTADNDALIYAQSEKCPTGCKITWYRFDIASGIATMFKPEIITIDPPVWKHLTNLENPPEISPRQSRSISPNGTWVIYSRMSPSYTLPPCAKGACLPMMELWLARVDGSESIKLDDLGRGMDCDGLGWSATENKVLLSCGYEGPRNFMIADLRNRTLTNLDEVVGQHIASLDWAALSPDGARLAVNNLVSLPVNLLVVPLDGSSIENLGQCAQAPEWSSDSRRLYYLQRVTPDKCMPAAIHVYDFATNHDRIVLGPDVVLSPAQHVTLNACDHSFQISPFENAALLVLGDSGSWIVGLH